MTTMPKSRVDWSTTGPLVGRRRAVASLRSALASARLGEPAVVLLEGGPGIGKSRLIQEARAFAGPDATFVSGRFFANPPGPLGPLVDTVLPSLREAGILEAAELGAHAAVLRDLTEGRFPNRDEWLQSSGDRLRPALLAAVERWVGRETVTFTFDDLQWADEASVAVLEHLVLGVLDASGRRGQHAAFILASQETTDGSVARLVTRLRSQPATVSLRLEGLTEVETASLVRHGTGLQCPPQLLRRVLEATAGNPLIVLELFRRSGAVGEHGLELPAEVRIPTTALETARAALGTLESEERHTLAAASQWYGAFTADDLAPVLGEPPERVDSHLDSGLRHGLITAAGDGYEFAVPTMREAAAQELSRTEAARLNSAIAGLLRVRAQPAAARIARHLFAAGRLCPAQERRQAFLEAADASFAARAYADAALWYERGLPADGELAPGVETAELLLRCAVAHQRNMDVPASERRFGQALAWCRECGDTEGWGHALMGLMRAAMAHGQVPTDRHPYEDEYRQFVAEARADGATVAAVMASRASGLHFVGSAEAATLAHEALETAEEVGSDFAEVLARVALGLVALDDMDGEEATYQNERAVEAAKRLDDPWFQCWGLQNLAPALILQGKVTAAIEAIEQTRAAAREAGNTASAGFASACGLALAAACGDLNGADIAADESLAMLERSSHAQTAWLLLPTLAAMRTWQGDYEGAIAAADRLNDFSRRAADNTRAYIGAVAERAAPGLLAMPSGAPALDVARLSSLSLRVDALAWREELVPAPALRTALESLVVRGVRFTYGPCLSVERFVAELRWIEGDQQGAGQAIAAAIESCQRGNLSLELSRCQLAWAQHLIESGEIGAAEEHLRDAMTLAVASHATAIYERCITLAQRAGFPDMDEATPDATGATRPFDVLIEWAQGENMASIAKTFLLHERTVEDNLKEALATYHVRTRAEAAALLSKLGIGRRSERPHAARSVFLFTDIVDSTPINVRLGDALWAQVVGIHDAQIRDSVERYGGRVIKTIGDGTFAAFSSVESAIRASQAIQAQPAFYVPGHPEVRVVDRIGVHAGSAVAVEHDYLGLAVTVTSRLCGLAEGKQILLSESVRRALPHALTPSLVDRGKVGLKGLAGRLRIFELPAQVHM